MKIAPHLYEARSSGQTEAPVIIGTPNKEELKGLKHAGFQPLQNLEKVGPIYVVAGMLDLSFLEDFEKMYPNATMDENHTFETCES